MTAQLEVQLCALAQQHRAEIAFLQALLAANADAAVVQRATEAIARHLNENIVAIIAANSEAR